MFTAALSQALETTQNFIRRCAVSLRVTSNSGIPLSTSAASWGRSSVGESWDNR